MLKDKRKLFFNNIKKSWVAEHLIAYFPFNNDPDDVVQNVQPTSFNASYLTGKNDMSVEFDGTDNNYAQYPPNDVFSFVDNNGDDVPFTMFGWFYWYSKGNVVLVMKRDSQNGDSEYQISTYNNRLYFMLFSQGDHNKTIYAMFNIRTILPANEWVHFIATYDGCGSSSCMEFYMNGVKINTTKRNYNYVKMKKTTSKLALGNRVFANGFNFNGRMDGIGFLDISVDDTLALDLYNIHKENEIL